MIYDLCFLIFLIKKVINQGAVCQVVRQCEIQLAHFVFWVSMLIVLYGAMFHHRDMVLADVAIRLLRRKPNLSKISPIIPLVC